MIIYNIFFEKFVHNHFSEKESPTQKSRYPKETKDTASIVIMATINETAQINIFQKHLFLHQVTYNKTKDCSLNYEFTTYVKITSSEYFVYINCSECQNKDKNNS